MKYIPRIPFVADYPSRREWEIAALHALISEMRKLSETELQEFISTVTTSTELHNLLMRAATLHRLDRGIKYREIGRELFLTQQTISMIKHSLKNKRYLSYNKRGKTTRKKRTYSSTGDRRAANPNYGKRKRSGKYGTYHTTF